MLMVSGYLSEKESISEAYPARKEDLGFRVYLRATCQGHAMNLAHVKRIPAWQPSRGAITRANQGLNTVDDLPRTNRHGQLAGIGSKIEWCSAA